MGLDFLHCSRRPPELEPGAAFPLSELCLVQPTAFCLLYQRVLAGGFGTDGSEVRTQPVTSTSNGPFVLGVWNVVTFLFSS